MHSHEYTRHTTNFHIIKFTQVLVLFLCVNSFLHTKAGHCCVEITLAHNTLTDMRLNRQRDVIAVVRPEVDLVLRESERLGRDLVLAREHLEAGAVGRTRVVIVVDGGVALHRHRDFLVGEQDLDRFCDVQVNYNEVNANYTANP